MGYTASTVISGKTGSKTVEMTWFAPLQPPQGTRVAEERAKSGWAETPPRTPAAFPAENPIGMLNRRYLSSTRYGKESSWGWSRRVPI